MRGVSTKSMYPLLSSKIVQWIVGAEALAGTTSFNSLSNYINGIPSLIDLNRAIYSLSVVDRAISFINLEHHVIGQLVYAMT